MSKPSIKNIVVFGLGAAGSNWLLNMVHTHPDLSYLAVDFDTVEPRNYEAGTQPYAKIDLNRFKVQAMQRIIQAAKNKKIDGKVTRIENETQLLDMVPRPAETLIVDALDNAVSRNLFRRLKGTWNILHIGFSAQMNGEVVWAESYSEMPPDTKGDFDICLMQTARPFIQCLTSIASLIATEFIETGVKRNAYFDSWLKLLIF